MKKIVFRKRLFGNLREILVTRVNIVIHFFIFLYKKQELTSSIKVVFVAVVACAMLVVILNKLLQNHLTSGGECKGRLEPRNGVEGSTIYNCV